MFAGHTLQVTLWSISSTLNAQPSGLGSQASLLISLYRLLWGDPRSIIERLIIVIIIID